MGKLKIDTIQQFQHLLEEHESFVFFKNSMTCPISSQAFSEYDTFTNAYPELPSYYLNVQQSRELSNYIAETFNVKHESPQVLLFKNKEVKWHISHWNITKKTLVENCVK
ncbi:bacillithiol system redox-active protein YtxJ [Bacillus sp. FJAT-47783]|uniref:bacillithiol system redox-active protein YtxJ n=1 Tax=Bacillus sp. FJAT-47783 TaxID=2922712 RepID=UPI001FABC1F6|nr:bacillithiol system redox-active protein YtxJ [Bacillus sp. FJAT-47783]